MTDRDDLGGVWGLEGARCVVVGASEGIGAAIALAFARVGAQLVIAGRDARRLASTAEAIQSLPGEVTIEEVDVRNAASITAFAESVLAKGTPRVVVNSAGGTLRRRAMDVGVDDWDDLFNTHVRGTFLVSQAFAAAMADAKYGKIINLSSTSGLMAPTGRVVYATAKAAIIHLTAALGAEWAPHGIRVNAIAPGTVLTPRTLGALGQSPGAVAELVARIPLGRIAEPDDVVGAALYLASGLSDFVVGQTLVVDGGWLTTKSAGAL